MSSDRLSRQWKDQHNKQRNKYVCQMDYIELSFQNSPGQNELLIALLSEEEYESFEETESGVKAYIPSTKFSEEKIKEVIETLKESGNISFTKALIKDRNWNELWESNFEP